MPSDPSKGETSLTTDDPIEWVEVGCVARPHGIRGEVRVKVHNPDSEVLFGLTEVMVRVGQTPDRLMPILRARPAAEGVALIALEGVIDRTQAEALRGALLLVPRQALPATDEDEFYVHDILGANVVGPDGTCFGQVVDYVSYPTADVLVVQGERRYEIPVIDDFVRNVDPHRKTVTVEGIDDFETT